MKQPALLLVAAVLLAAVGIQFYPVVIPPPPTTKSGELRTTIPANVPGWTSAELDIADTPEMKAAVEDTLRFDDSLVRHYRRGNVSVILYVAYWGPGKMPYRMVGAHSPDTCWVQNGWKREDRSQWASCPTGEPFAQPIEWGTYRREGFLSQVLFWHVVGGELYAFEQHGLHNPFGIFHDFARFGLAQRREQFFVRVSSNVPFDEIWDDPGFQQFMTPLWNLGVPAGQPNLQGRLTTASL